MDIVEIIRNGSCGEIDLLEYVTDNDIEIALAAASSESATAPILDIAAHDLDERVRIAALNNPNVGDKTLIFLMNDQNEEIATTARKLMERRK